MRLKYLKRGAVCCVALLAACNSQAQLDWDAIYSDPFAYQGIEETNQRSSAARVDYALDRISKIDHAGPNLQSVLLINPSALETAKTLDSETTKRSQS